MTKQLSNINWKPILVVGGIWAAVKILGPLLEGLGSVANAIKKILSIPNNLIESISMDDEIADTMFEFYQKLSKEFVYNPDSPQDIELMERLKKLPYDTKAIAQVIKDWTSPKLGRYGVSYANPLSQGMRQAANNLLESLAKI